jgi:hypothetical protein
MIHVDVRRLTSFAVIGFLLLAAAPARATLSGAADTNFTGFTCSGGASSDGDCQRSAAFTVNTPTTFTSRYAWNVNADTIIFSTHDTSSNAQHNITFTATAPGGYRLDISTTRVGALGRSSDASGCDGSADTNGITGSSNVALNSGTLSIGDPGSIGNGGGDSNVPYNQSSGTAQIFRVSNGAGQSHSLTFTWNGSVRSNSCEASVRQGEGSGSTSGCGVCGYPGSPSRTQSSDGHFVTVSFTSLCGNGTIDGAVGEQCDAGSANGAFGTCCNTNCTFASSSTACRSAAGPCDAVENCTGSSATCPADGFLPGSTVCRASAGVCDIAENCTGTGPGCPANFFASPFTTCRASAGVCDPAENCTGSSAACPADAKSSAVCRAAAGTCDVAESCDGVNNDCPPDVLVSAGMTCRASAGDCDVAETCTGSSPTCPPNAFEPSSVTCRPATGVCDVAENCTGSSAACPADSVVGAFVECRASAGVCDQAENCNGVDKDCPIDSVMGAFVECRAAAGPCDVAENCDGVGVDCPADALESSSVTCRPAAGTCDVAENCTGSSPSCPADALEPSSVECRASGGLCDLTENCTGSSAACPADAKSTAECRAAVGACDVAESCDGVNNDCPADALAGAGTECRAATGVCDVAEVCDGLSGTCPPDLILPDGTSCSDNNMCTGPDTCQSGECVGVSQPQNCADHYLCYKTKGGSFSTVSNVHLVDQFEDINADVKKVKTLCPPADKNGEGIIDSVTHLQAYQFRAVSGTPSFIRRTHVQIDNQLGTYFVDAYKRDLLLVPTNKSLVGPTTPPDNGAIGVDHYKCYKAKTTPGTPKFPKTTVQIADQFTSPAKSIVLKKIKHLCTPVDKNGEGIKNPDAHLVCYQAKTAKGQPKHVRQTGVNTANQFGSLVVGTSKESEFCVPSLKTVTP